MLVEACLKWCRMCLKCLVNLCFIQKVDLCHILLKVVERDDLLSRRPLNLLNLYSFPTRNLLDLVARVLAACISAEFFLLWSSPLIPLKDESTNFLESGHYFSKDVTTFENGSYASDKSTKESFVSLQSHIVMLFCINCICFQRYGFSILGYIVQCSLYF